ncbi:MAG: hypothetical protein V4609_13320 [Pseudomonadota bacterium]
MTEADLVYQQDSQRTARAFIAFLGTAFGVDQAMPGADGYAVNYPNGYQSIGPTGVGVEGKPISTAQGAFAGLPSGVVLLGLAVVGYLLVKG